MCWGRQFGDKEREVETGFAWSKSPWNSEGKSQLNEWAAIPTQGLKQNWRQGRKDPSRCPRSRLVVRMLQHHRPRQEGSSSPACCRQLPLRPPEPTTGVNRNKAHFPQPQSPSSGWQRRRCTCPVKYSCPETSDNSKTITGAREQFRADKIDFLHVKTMSSQLQQVSPCWDVN